MLLTNFMTVSPVGVFAAIFAMGLLAMWLGARLFRLRRPGAAKSDDGLIIDGVVAPVLGLFALLVAFTFGQALTLESSTYSGVVSTKLAARSLESALNLLPDEERGRIAPLAAAYFEDLTAAIDRNSLSGDMDRLLARDAALRKELARLQANGVDVLDNEVSGLTIAVGELFVNSAQRIPRTVFSIQSLYYCVCFLLLGYKTAEHGVYAESRVFIVGLALLFAMVMYMAMHIGRPGLNSMLFDPLPK